MEAPKQKASFPGSGRLTRIITTKATELLVYTFSGVMVETTAWRPDQLPKWPKNAKVFRLLLVLGNVIHLGSEGLAPFWDDVANSGNWDHVVYVPGVRDYGGGGTMQLGDETLGILETWALDYNMTVVGTNCKTKALYFTGPHVLMAAAPCFPTASESYLDAAVYQCWKRPGTTMDETHIEAVESKHDVTSVYAKERLRCDLDSLKRVFENANDTTAGDSCIRAVISHGCPDELAAHTRTEHPFYACFSLGNKKDYTDFNALGAHYWFCGAPTDAPITTMAGSTTKIVSNCFDAGWRKLPTLDPICLSAVVK